MVVLTRPRLRWTFPEAFFWVLGLWSQALGGVPFHSCFKEEKRSTSRRALKNLHCCGSCSFCTTALYLSVKEQDDVADPARRQGLAITAALGTTRVVLVGLCWQWHQNWFLLLFRIDEQLVICRKSCFDFFSRLFKPRKEWNKN